MGTEILAGRHYAGPRAWAPLPRGFGGDVAARPARSALISSKGRVCPVKNSACIKFRFLSFPHNRWCAPGDPAKNNGFAGPRESNLGIQTMPARVPGPNERELPASSAESQ